jgi:hypothetical protein
VQNGKALPRGARTHYLVCLELVHVDGAERQTVEVIASIPNRDGTVSKSWELQEGLVNGQVLSDLSAYVQGVCYDAVYASQTPDLLTWRNSA